ncbi:uncharacterized protein LOC124170230 [Ischnura elegans]|uniref:uncharacterized protein LOC124170230 n=1 Tax=Ischnura elegans TaxID=197161 RepID=UPI001ED899CA|nr:uncharacterized protein LOC124170230 [Ischnura elegans]
MSRNSGIFSDSSGRNDIEHCRLCMTSHDYYYNIFTSNVECKITVKDALHELVGLQVVVGDGLPTTVCPLCLKKLTEFSVFKKICLESNAVLIKSLPKNYCSSAEGDRAADDKLGPSVRTKDGIRDVNESTSEFACSAQMTEVFIPVPDCLLPRDDKSFSVKMENEDQLSEGNYPVQYTPNPAGISSDASDPLATDELPRTSTASRGEEMDAGARGAVLKDLDWKLIEAKNEPSAEESDAAKPTYTENGEFTENWTMAHESTVEAAETLQEAVGIERKMANCEDTDLEAFFNSEMDGKRKRVEKDLRYPDECSSSSMENGDDRIPKPPSPVAWVPSKKSKIQVLDNSANVRLREAETVSVGVQHVLEKPGHTAILPGEPNEVMEELRSLKKEVLEEVRDLKRKLTIQTLEGTEAIAELKNKIMDLESQLKDSRFSSGTADIGLRDLYSLPVGDVGSLLNLEGTIIENNEYREFLICHLKERSSNILFKCSHNNQMRAGLNRTVNDMCSTLMSNELAASFCMKGRSENKMAFEVNFSSIINVIFESVKAKGVPGAIFDTVSVKRSIGEWFRVSKYRTEEGKKKRRSVPERQGEEL